MTVPVNAYHGVLLLLEPCQQLLLLLPAGLIQLLRFILPAIVQHILIAKVRFPNKAIFLLRILPCIFC